jgi:hypothetical protein
LTLTLPQPPPKARSEEQISFGLRPNTTIRSWSTPSSASFTMLIGLKRKGLPKVAFWTTLTCKGGSPSAIFLRGLILAGTSWRQGFFTFSLNGTLADSLKPTSPNLPRWKLPLSDMRPLFLPRLWPAAPCS